MEQVINRVLEGDFVYERGSLDFSCSRLELVIEKGQTIEDSFYIYGVQGMLTEGYVVSSDMRMQCLTPYFVGAMESIGYRFNSEGMEEGDVIQGDFYVISNQGEYYLPFVVTMIHKVLDSSMGPIKNMFHFANLAKADMDEAVRLFYSPRFIEILKGNDRQYLNLYRGLSQYYGSRQNMEEFLISINKKQRIEFIADETEIELEEPEGVVQGTVTVTKNGWGYSSLKVETDGAFLSAEQELITEDSFLGNVCRLSYFADSGLMHSGNNYGVIRLYNQDTDIRIYVTAYKDRVHSDSFERGKEYKKLTYDLMEYYQQFRAKRIGTSVWLKETRNLVDSLALLNDRSVEVKLFKAQLLITEERFQEAKWILERLEEFLSEHAADEPELWSYYLYLTTLYNREESYVDEVAAEVEEIYKRNQGSWRIAWLLIYLSKEYGSSISKRWMFLEEQFRYGCRSPIIYIEAAQLMRANPALLMKLGDYEIHVLGYMVKRELLTPDTIEQTHSLASREKEYSRQLFSILKACYYARPEKEVLHALCTHLIKGNCIGEDYFVWYQRAVEQELRITRLYDYYMLSIDMEYKDPLPKVILMYFSYHSDLDYERNAFLYANIHKNQEQFPEVYRAYENHIEQFVAEQAVKGHITRELAYLYKNVLMPEMITEEVAEGLSHLIFMNQIAVKQKGFRQVVVYHARMNREFTYPIISGRAMIPLVSSDYLLLFEDAEQNRCYSSVDYTLEKLLLPARLSKMISPYVRESLGFNIYMCECGSHYVTITEENAERFLHILTSDGFDEEYKKEISLKLIQFYYETDRLWELDDYLGRVEPEAMGHKERAEVIRFLVIRGFYEKTFEWIKKYGAQGVDPKILVRLCSRLLERDECRNDIDMKYIIMHAFRRGKYAESLLLYLMEHYEGMTKDLRDIWKAAEQFDLDTYGLCEKMLLQMLYTGSFVGEKTAVFRAYVSGGGKVEIERAFLSQCAYDYFVKDKLTESFVFQEIFRLCRQGEPVQLVCRLAAVKYYAENKQELSEEDMPVLIEFLEGMLEDGIRLPVFKEYTLSLPMMTQFMDKTIIEYKAHPGSRVVMHYVIENEDSAEGAQYHTEEMQEIYGGVCVKEFILFFGEQLQYYIVEERDGAELLTQSDTIQKSDIGDDCVQSRFGLINDIAISKTLQDYETADSLLEEYFRLDYETENLFGLE